MSSTPRTETTSPLAVLWRYRVLFAGVLCVALAVAGEGLMRSPVAGGIAPDAALGARLVQVAVLLVGLVAWVRDGPARKRRAVEEASPASLSTLPVRRAASLPTRPARPEASPEAKPNLAARYSALRASAGWRGTLAGLALVAALGAWLYFVLDRNFSDPLAPWLWAAMLAVLFLTFAGLPPLGDRLLPHDPAESAQEPPVGRNEWLLILVILVAAAILRTWDLEHIPAGPYIDEADRALRGRFINGSGPGQLQFMPFSFFSTDWWGVPTAYFWLVAQSMKLFGDTLAGARAVHALAGIATVWYVYRIGRLAWSPRAGLLAAALLAISDFAIQFSRTAGESTITIFTWTVCFYYLYRALKTMRPADFALSGIAGGLTLYGYVSGKLLPVFMVVLAAYLLVRWGLSGARRVLPGLVLFALAAFLVYAPNGLFVLKHPSGFTMRYNGTAIFFNQPEMAAQYRTDDWGAIIAGQYALTYSAFDVGQERGPFYPTHCPILPVPWAALWILGTAYTAWRVGDARFAVLGVWIVSGLAGAALTNDTPTMQRVAGMVPTLALVPAVFVDRLISGVPALRLPSPGRVLRPAANLAVAALVVLLASQTLTFYFGPYTAEAHYLEFTLVGRYAEKLDPKRDIVLQSGTPILLGSPAPTYFLARDVTLRDFSNASDELPIVGNAGKNAHFIIFPPNDPALDALREVYPGGASVSIPDTRGNPFLTAYKVSSEQIDSLRTSTARYTSATGAVVERREPRLGTSIVPGSPSPLALPDLSYPAQARWSGGLVVPGYGLYHLYLTAPAGGSLALDGKQVLSTTTNQQPADVRLVLARGVHQVVLQGALQDSSSHVELRWCPGDRVPVPVAGQYLWGGTDGALLGQVYGDAGGFSGMLAPNLGQKELAPLGLPVQDRRDLLLDWHNLNASTTGGPNLLAAWRGKLRIPTEGVYTFDGQGDGMISMWIDGKLAGSSRVAGTPAAFPASVPLTPGEHEFELRFRAQSRSAGLSVYWQGPGISRQVIPPSAFGLVDGGVWQPGERPKAPIPPAWGQ